jgi:predicted SAM-dependent methyltransferase
VSEGDRATGAKEGPQRLDGALARMAPHLERIESRFRREVARRAGISYRQLPPRQAVRMAYNVLLRREPDEPTWTDQAAAMVAGTMTHEDVVDRIRCSNEFRTQVAVGPANLHSALHASRCEFIIGLPPARRIVDLGGGHTNDARGALVVLGYPYDFDELVVVDLPPDDRHPLYRSAQFDGSETERGRVRYEYRSMTDLSFAADASVDLVYSGQSIEHVTEGDADVVLAEAFRVLVPGGAMAIDTPNGRVCRFQQDAFIDPDHEMEYTLEQLVTKVTSAGFEVVSVRGLNWGGRAAAEGRYDQAALARYLGIYADAANCYLLALVLRKPGPS